jgi:hypothetical protein
MHGWSSWKSEGRRSRREAHLLSTRRRFYAGRFTHGLGVKDYAISLKQQLFSRKKALCVDREHGGKKEERNTAVGSIRGQRYLIVGRSSSSYIRCTWEAPLIK